MITLLINILFLLSSLDANILTGLDVIEKDGFKLLHDKNIGLVGS